MQTQQSKEWHLTEALLQYTAACVAEGDMGALRDMGVDPDTAHLFASLRMEDMQRLSRAGSRGHLMHVRIDPVRLKRLREYVGAERERGRIRARLMELDAPQPLMQHLFGISPKDYADWRRALGVSGGVGRISHPDEAGETQAWRVWDTQGRPRPEAMDASAWVALAERTNTDIRTLWRLVHEWLAQHTEDAA